MGGYGSGRWGWYTPKLTVEDCLILDVNPLQRQGLFSKPAPDKGAVGGAMRWTSTRTGEEQGVAAYLVEQRGATGLVFRLLYSVKGKPMDLSFPCRRYIPAFRCSSPGR